MKKAEFSKKLIYEYGDGGKRDYMIYHTYNSLLSLLYRLRISFIKVKPKKKTFNVSVCAIFKNEAPYLKEWIEFNHLIGIDHFYLYNNNSEDNYLEILKEYIESGLVTLTEWPYNQAQMKCYMDCIEKYSSQTKWLGFIDIDEFIVPKKVNNIYDFLEPFEKKYGSVKLYWKMFGTSGLMDRNMANLVTEDFTVCWPKHYNVGKCFYNTAFAFSAKSTKNEGLHHSFWANYKGMDIPPVNEFGRLVVGNRNSIPNRDMSIQINHYFTKSYKEYAMKRSKGDVYFKINPHDEEYFDFHEMLCTDVDYSAYKYLVKLKNCRKQK